MVYRRCKPCSMSLHVGRFCAQRPLWGLCRLYIAQAAFSLGHPERTFLGRCSPVYLHPQPSPNQQLWGYHFNKERAVKRWTGVGCQLCQGGRRKEMMSLAYRIGTGQWWRWQPGVPRVFGCTGFPKANLHLSRGYGLQCPRLLVMSI